MLKDLDFHIEFILHILQVCKSVFIYFFVFNFLFPFFICVFFYFVWKERKKWQAYVTGAIWTCPSFLCAPIRSRRRPIYWPNSVQFPDKFVICAEKWQIFEVFIDPADLEMQMPLCKTWQLSRVRTTTHWAMFGAFLTWILTQTSGLDNTPGVKPGLDFDSSRVLGVTQLAANASPYKGPPAGLEQDGFVLILVRCYCYSLALVYFCISFRLRQGLLRFRLYWITPENEDFQDVDLHLPWHSDIFRLCRFRVRKSQCEQVITETNFCDKNQNCWKWIFAVWHWLLISSDQCVHISTKGHTKTIFYLLAVCLVVYTNTTVFCVFELGCLEISRMWVHCCWE